ncbi:SURF1 family cytochrome oxidase biogenesis protein [Agrococcus carbonis]|uniref:SURF1-like protein n=1 Tax=Agrococcus carbonis TaxID=684552 RepID=A0A1H1QX26_9MICO|nr:SURF1 family cytochrome oxidase biogenesis protein [Agrococcus carbonis]SDS27930.1 Cytochrome oxidase assembly protein ShyY1 [Agrococcus carbonis]
MSTPTPTFKDVARRPRWIGVLVLCIAVAGVFALLGQWQIERAVEQGRADDRDTETAVPLETVAEPASTLTTEAGGRMVAFRGAWVPEDFDTIAGRDQHGDTGTWVIGRVLVEQPQGEPASLPVALAWYPDAGEAERAAAVLAETHAADAPADLVGRLMPPEAPTMGDLRDGTREAMSVAALINQWSDWNGLVYGSYAILDEPSAAASGALEGDAEPIVSMRPEVDTQLNALNIFYAIEWVAFMLFAFYLWYRLVKDAVEREVEAIEDAQAAAEAGPGPGAVAGPADGDRPRR